MMNDLKHFAAIQIGQVLFWLFVLQKVNPKILYNVLIALYTEYLIKKYAKRVAPLLNKKKHYDLK